MESFIDLFGGFNVEVFHAQVRLEQFDHLTVDVVFGEEEEHVEEGGRAHALRDTARDSLLVLEQKKVRKGMALWKAIYLERFGPCRFGADFFGVSLDWNDLLLEEEQHTVHDSHDEMRRFAELSHCCDVRQLIDGLKKNGQKCL